MEWSGASVAVLALVGALLVALRAFHRQWSWWHGPARVALYLAAFIGMSTWSEVRGPYDAILWLIVLVPLLIVVVTIEAGAWSSPYGRSQLHDAEPIGRNNYWE